MWTDLALVDNEELRAITTDRSVSYGFGNTPGPFDQPPGDVAHAGDGRLQLFAGQRAELQPGFLEIAEKGRVLRHRHESATKLGHAFHRRSGRREDGAADR